MKRGIQIKVTNQLLCDCLKLPTGSRINYIAQSSEDYCNDIFTIIIESTDERFPEWEEGMVVKSGTLQYKTTNISTFESGFDGVSTYA